MIQLAPGLRNSLIVLEHLRNNEELNRLCDINVGTFTNCRECGLTFTILGFCDDEGKCVSGFPDSVFTYCVYEHRNSDEIIINGKEGYINMNGDLPYNGDSKHTYLASFTYSNHYKCAEKLAEMMLKSRENYFKSISQKTEVV